MMLLIASKLSTFESCLGIHVLPGTVGAPGQADHHRHRLAVRSICETDRQRHGADSEQKLSRQELHAGTLKEGESCGWMWNAAGAVYIGVEHRRPERPGSETSEDWLKFAPVLQITH
jgi:hypothetical protein